MNQYNEQTHEVFKQRHAASPIAVELAAEWLRALEYRNVVTEVPYVIDSPGRNPSNHGDIRLEDKNGVRCTVEVKHRDVSFTTRFPFNPLYIASPYDHKRKMSSGYPVLFYLNFSSDFRHAAVLPYEKFNQMFLAWDFDSVQNTSVQRLSADVGILDYFEVPPAIVEKFT